MILTSACADQMVALQGLPQQMLEQQQMTGIDKAVAAAGGARQLAQQLGVTRQAVQKWQQCGWVPTSRALEIEQLHGMSRWALIKPAIAAILSAD